MSELSSEKQGDSATLGLKALPGGPKKYAPALIAVKIYYSELELIEVLKRAQKRGFSVIVPKSGEKPSTGGLSDYFRTIDAESAKWDDLQRAKARNIAQEIEDYKITQEMITQARLKL